MIYPEAAIRSLVYQSLGVAVERAAVAFLGRPNSPEVRQELAREVHRVTDDWFDGLRKGEYPQITAFFPDLHWDHCRAPGSAIASQNGSADERDTGPYTQLLRDLIQECLDP